VLLHFSDRIIRAVRIRVSPPQSVEIKVPNKQEITQIVFTQDGNRKPQPGQFVFVSINDGTIFSRFANFFNWHPFTISEVFDRDVRKPESATIANDKDVSATLGSPSTEHDYEEARNIAVTENVEGPFYASVHIKGVGSETRRLNRQANNEPQCLKVKVDGPYGSSAMALEMNQVVTFFEAGIGITPSLTMFRDLAEKCVRDPLMVHTTHIYFIWAIPNIGMKNSSFRSHFLSGYLILY
jgi:NAD(P)H-flavin reductase